MTCRDGDTSDNKHLRWTILYACPPLPPQVLLVPRLAPGCLWYNSSLLEAASVLKSGCMDQ